MQEVSEVSKERCICIAAAAGLPREVINGWPYSPMQSTPPKIPIVECMAFPIAVEQYAKTVLQ